MTNASLIPPEVEDRPRVGAPPAELAEDIVARPLTLPDFVDVPLKNPGLSARWMFTDRRRYAQAKSQGWRNATQQDVDQVKAKGRLSPYVEEGGTKYINGDLILMVIDRKIYLGALRYKHQVAAALADASVNRRLSAQKAVSELGSSVAAINQQRIAHGADPAMTVFTPGAAETLPGVMSNSAVAGKELGRLGHDGSQDMGTLADLASQADASKK